MTPGQRKARETTVRTHHGLTSSAYGASANTIISRSPTDRLGCLQREETGARLAESALVQVEGPQVVLEVDM
jgi:hypothetical protein